MLSLSYDNAKQSQFCIASASSLAYFVVSGGFKGLGNEARPSAVLAACSNIVQQAKTKPKSTHANKNIQHQQ